MAIAVTHSTAADGTFSATGVTAWDAGHSLTGFGTGVETALAVNVGSAGAFVTFNGALGTPSSGTLTNATELPYTGLAAGTAGNLITWSAAGAAAVVATGTATHVLTSNGAGAAPTFQAAAGGGTTLNGITAATGAVTIASGNNTGIVWNWANTSNTTVCHTVGETTAATNGTRTSGVPNQVLLKLATLTGSTMSPLSVYARGNHIFSVSPDTQQIFAAVAGGVAEPVYSFVGDAQATRSGLRYDAASYGTAMGVHDGVDICNWTKTYGFGVRAIGSDTESDLTSFVLHNTGLSWKATNTMSVTNSTDGEWARFLTRAFQVSSAKADAVSYKVNFRKSRGTVAVPTIIPAADVLMTISGAGYTGATYTYQETARLEFAQGAGTPTDAANTGTGSVVTLYGKTQGTDATVIAALSVTGGSTATIKFHGSGMVAANAAVATVLGSVGPTGAQTTVQEWLKVDTPTGTRYIPCF